MRKYRKRNTKFGGRNVYHHTSLVPLHSEFWADASLCPEFPPEAKCKNSLKCIAEAGCSGKRFFAKERNNYNPKSKPWQFCDSLIPLCCWSWHFPWQSEPLGRYTSISTYWTPLWCHHHQIWPRFGMSRKWLVQQTALESLRKTNVPCCLTFQVPNLPKFSTVTISTPALCEEIRWGVATNFMSDQINMV